MAMSDFTFVPDRLDTVIRFADEPVYNALCSLCLLSQDHLDRISNWVDTTKQHLNDEERLMAETACNMVHFAELGPGTTVEALLEAVESADPKTIKRLAVKQIRIKALRILDAAEIPSLEKLENDRNAFLDVIERIYTAHGESEMFDRSKEEAYFDDLSSGSTYRDRLVRSVRTLWEKYLRDEWPQVTPVIETSVRAFESIQIPESSVVEQLKFIVERDSIPESWMSTLETAREIVFIPSVHIGPFMILLHYDGTTAYIVGRARTPEGSGVHTPDLDRSDLLIRLEALSDGTRLRVLEMASERGSITTQDVMDALELSQSSASRHLTQLTATGLLSADASERTKKYSVNSGRVDQVFDGLKSLLGTPVRA